MDYYRAGSASFEFGFGCRLWKRPGIAVLGDSALGPSLLESEAWGLGLAMQSLIEARSDARALPTAQP